MEQQKVYYDMKLDEKTQEMFNEAIKDKQNFTLRNWGTFVMNTQNPDLKAALTLHAHKLWDQGKITEIGEVTSVDNPVRPDNLVSVHPSKMPRRKNNKEGGGIMLHTLTHVENIAIELSWDIAMRYDEKKYKLPKQFFDDWVRIASEEAKHYDLVKKRMEQFYGKTYGDYPVHQGLWDDALKTKDSLMDRLVLEHCVHEGRGIDITKIQTIPRFKEDPETQKILEEHIYPDEITHVREGLTWFRHICQNILDIKEQDQIVAKYHQTVKETLKAGFLSPPFDKEGRDKAGMTEEYYIPLQREPTKQ